MNANFISSHTGGNARGDRRSHRRGGADRHGPPERHALGDAPRRRSARKVLREVVDRAGVDPALVGDVVFGNVSQVGEQAANIGRNVVLEAGFPYQVPGTTVDRQCGSGQQAIHFAANLIAAGVVDIAIGGGSECMSRVPMGSNFKVAGFPFTEHMRDAVRPHVAGRRRRQHRAQVGHHARGHRRVRAREPEPREGGARRRQVREGDPRRSRSSTRASRASSRPTKASATPRSRSSRRCSRRSARTASTTPATPARSPTARRRCC